MSDEDASYSIIFGIGLIIGICSGAFFVDSIASRAEIAHGAAHYDAKTGKFTWNSEAPNDK